MKEKLAQNPNRHRKMEIVRVATEEKEPQDKKKREKKRPSNAVCYGGIKIITMKWFRV